MKEFVALFPLLVISVTALVWFEIKKKTSAIYVAKPVSTLLLVIMCLFSLTDVGSAVPYTLSILLGLLLSLGGDVALMFQEKPVPFRIGLLFFLAAHIVYGWTFLSFAGTTTALWPVCGLFLALGVVVFVLLLPGLGKMKVPVGLYILVISFMVAAAVSTLFSEDVTRSMAYLVAAGSLLFYASDLILALNRFRFPMKYNRLSLIPYYAGQFLITVSTYYFVEVI